MESVVPADLMKSYRENLERELGLVGKSRDLKQIKASLRDYANSTRTLTIAGPSSTGRKTIARAVHLSGPDWWRPFIEADLTGIDDEYSLKFIFGHREGHIFSSSEFKPGLVTLASSSTLCLSNFDNYSKAVQREIFNSYVDRKFKPVAGVDTKPLDCRIVFTVGGKPAELKKSGRVDEEVCGMLSEKIVGIPPLSKRRDDIVPLAEKFVNDCSKEFGTPPKKLSKEAERWLKKAPWNQNINQLKKSVYSACLNTSDNLLYPNHFALAHDGNLESYQEKQLEELSIQSLIEMKLESFLGRLGKFEASHVYEAIMNRVEEPLLRMVLDYAKGNQIRASRMLGINRNTLRTKLNKYKIKQTGRVV